MYIDIIVMSRERANIDSTLLPKYGVYVAKTKALISFAVTAKLICAFVFAYMQKAGFLMARFINIPLLSVSATCQTRAVVRVRFYCQLLSDIPRDMFSREEFTLYLLGVYYEFCLLS